MKAHRPVPGTDKAHASRLARLLATAEQLGRDELAVLQLIAERLVLGRRHYGTLRLAADRRDFADEALEEAADMAVYAAAGLLREKRGKVGR